jgi:hypothetical protein
MSTQIEIPILPDFRKYAKMVHSTHVHPNSCLFFKVG